MRNLHEELEKKLDYATKFYGLDYEVVPAGVLISSGSEYWVLKLKKNSIRRIMHQNHQKDGKTVNLPVNPSELTQEVVATYFHHQDNLNGDDLKDLKKICCYISNHKNARKAVSQTKLAVLERLNLQVQTQRRYA